MTDPRLKPTVAGRFIAIQAVTAPQCFETLQLMRLAISRDPSAVRGNEPSPTYDEIARVAQRYLVSRSNAARKRDVSRMKSVAVFNNKGGVGKTTLLCNIVAYLALERKRRVLVIDADPQCNATQALFSDTVLTALYDSTDEFTVYSVVQPLSMGKGYSETVTPKRSHNFGIDVIPGDPRLALTEDLLAQDWKSATSGDIRGLRTTYLFHQLLDRCLEYDYVFFDMGPSLGSINRAVLIAADYFISPMSIDIFSLRAIENISLSIVEWRKRLTTALELNTSPNEVPARHATLDIRFAGYVTQQYTARKDSSGQRREVTAYEDVMRRIPAAIKNEFVDVLQPQYSRVNYALGTVPNLHSLVPMSQNSRKPLFRLGKPDGIVGAHFTKVKDTAKLFSEIATKLEANIAKLK